MTDEAKDAGNAPAPDDGNAAQTADGTQEQDGRNAEADANIVKLNKELQEKAGRVNQAEAESKALRVQVEALTRAQSPAAPGADPRAERLAMVKKFADGSIGEGPDPVAAEVMELREALAMTVQELSNVRELDRIADEGKRDKITQHFNHNRHRLGDVKAARAEIEAEERAQALDAQQAEIDRLKKALEAQSKRPGADVIQTHAREVTAAEHKDIMTQAQWNERQLQLERQADAGDLEAARLRRREQVQRANGKLRVEG